MSEAPVKTCDYCGNKGEMPTFMDGETSCMPCLSKPYRKWERKHVDAYLAERGMVAVQAQSRAHTKDEQGQVLSKDSVHFEPLEDMEPWIGATSKL
jgi:hypothetical protein